MRAFFATIGGAIARLVSGPWADIILTHPTTSGTNGDLQITWTGGAPTRTVKNSWASGGTLEYRINSGSYVTYTQGGSGFTITVGQTVGWRFTPGGNISTASAVVTCAGVQVGSFQMGGSGYP